MQLLAEEFSRKEDFHVEILACNDQFSRYSLEDTGYRVHKAATLGVALSMPVSLQFPFLARRFDPDIIHFHHPFPLGEVSFLLGNSRAKWVATWHSDIIRQKCARRFYRPFLSRFLERVDCLLPTSDQLVSISSFLGPYREKCRVVPLGIDVGLFEQGHESSSDRVRQLRSLARPVILAVGRFVHYKGFEYLVRAMTEVEASLALVGEGPLLGEYKRIIDQLNLSDKVRFFVDVPDEELGLFYHQADVFVLPSVSLNESFGLVQLEAMSCKKPVITTSLPTGVASVNLDGKTGLVVPPRDSSALAGAINRLLSDPGMARTYGEQGRQRVEAHFTKERMVASVELVYREVLSGPLS